ncbi:hypothetical protein [Pseudostreptobacillus hongkongensis]|uniref:hypothetical protein n=1 Tax=Pseudostreptobacillus hongkongensis TaxID=1162717 RepID=UPI000835B50B|nr:hypothetical protein [Pseudostreptobacillus hongkongensis]
MAKIVSSIFELKDNFSKKMKKMSLDTQKEFSTLKKKSAVLKSKLSGAFKAIAKAGAVMVAGLVASTKAYISESLKAWEDQERAELLLTSTLKKRKNMTDEVVKSMLDYGGEMQKIGVVGDEVVQMGMNELAMLGLKTETIKKLTPSMLDMLVKQKGLNATMEDSAAVGQAIAKSISKGTTKALQQYGIYLSSTEQKAFKLMDTEKKAMFLRNKINKSVGGANNNLLNTAQGQVKSIQNMLGDIQEEVGQKVSPVLVGIFKTLGSTIERLKPKMMEILDRIIKMQPQLQNLVDKGVNLLINGVDKLFSLLDFATEHWESIKVGAIVFGALYVAVNTIIGVYHTYIAVSTLAKVAKEIELGLMIKSKIAWIAETGVKVASTVATGALTAATWLLNAAMVVLTSPITLVVVGLGLLAGAGYLVYKNFDTIKAKAVELWNQFKETEVFAVIKSLFEGYVSIFKEVWGWIQKIMGGIGDMIGKVPQLLSKIPVVGKLFKSKDNEQVPKHALGTSYFKGGLTSINERGGEIVNLPNGTQIIPHDVSVKSAKNKDGGISVTLNIHGNMIGNEEYARQIATTILNGIKLQRGNI